MPDSNRKKKKQKLKFKLNTIEDLKLLAGMLDVSIEALEDVSNLAQPVQVDGLLMPNSLAIHPMEAADGNSQGRPGELTLRRYERFARGGAGLIWVEATAVVPEGRANPRQLWLNKRSKDSFAGMVRMMREVAADSMGADHRPVIVLQLTHSGRYSKPQGTPHPLICERNPYKDGLSLQREPDPKAESKIPDDWPVITDEYLDKLVDTYVEAARTAFEVGFDAVDVKACHGYLIGELLACHNRSGKYGGSFENRTRFLIEVIDRIRDRLGEDKPVVTRLGVYDAVPYPFGWAVDKKNYLKPDLIEPKRLITSLAEHGVKMINVTVGDPHYNPHCGRPFNAPVIGGYSPPEHPLASASRLISLTGEIQAEFSDIAIVGTGYSWLGTLMPNVAAANKAVGLATVVGVGRMAFAYPDFAKDIIHEGRLDPARICVACSKCTQIMVDGGMIGCAMRDNEIYGPIYKHGRMTAKSKS